MPIRRYDGCNLSDDILIAWRRLTQSETGLNNPLFTPTWVQSVAAVKEGVEVAVVSQDEIPLAFLPFDRRGREGYPVGGDLSDVHGLIASPTSTVDLAELIRECELTALHYDHLPADEADQPWFTPNHARIEDAALIELKDGFDAYWRSRHEASVSWTKQIKRKHRKLAREVGPLRFDWHNTNRDSLRALIDWKRRQLTASRFNDMFSSPWMCPLLNRLLDSENEECQGVLSTLFAGEHLVAVHFGIRNRHTMVSSIPTHNSEFNSYSPGAILHVELARAAAEREIQSIDLGRGINPLKRALGSTTRKLAIGTIDLRRSRRWLRGWWFRLRDVARTWPMGRLPRLAYRQVRQLMSRTR